MDLVNYWLHSTVFPPGYTKMGGGGDLAGAQSMKLYLGAWCMYILHS